ncbi:MAG: hypothetical protein HYS22_03505 [Deltaproteobacteria bacterium]|nr:hypothetical protein [Deltaproteobacteria bacterium]
MKRILIVLAVGGVVLGMRGTAKAACTDAASVTTCTQSEMMSQEMPTSVKMCFKSVDFCPVKDGKPSCETADRDNLFTAADGAEIDVMNLGSGLDLSGVSGLTMGSLQKSTSYPCAVANVSQILMTTAGSTCNMTAALAQETGVSDFMTNMYMRGSDSCPGDTNYPSTLPVKTNTDTTASFKFNVQMAQGTPLFIFKPVSGASIDEGQSGTVSLSMSGAAPSGGIYCGVFKKNDPQEGGGPDGGGGKGTNNGDGTATFTLSLAASSEGVAYKQIGCFQDVNNSGPNTGPDSSDTVCATSGFSLKLGETSSQTCTFAANQQGVP